MVLKLYTTHQLLDLANCCGDIGYNSELSFIRIKKWCVNTLSKPVMIDRLSTKTCWTFNNNYDIISFKLRWDNYVIHINK